MDDWDIDPDRAEVNGLTDLDDLWMASDPEELWRALILHSGRSTTHHWEAVQLFRHHHADGAAGALTTASLLCTDGRWDRCTARLIAGIADASILSEDDLDELGARFLWSDRFLYEYPVSWIGLEWVSIDLTGGRRAARRSVVHLDPTTPVPTRRTIAPPLRRWSARRVLRADPSRFDAIRDRASALGSRDGGAIVSGLLDAVEALDQDVTRQAIHLGLAWPQGSVRLLALDLLAADDPEGARRWAAADPDAKVRRWTPRRPSKRDAVDAAVRDGSRPQVTEKPRGQRHVPGDRAGQGDQVEPGDRIDQIELFPE
jgi:hypothetical protein